MSTAIAQQLTTKKTNYVPTDSELVKFDGAYLYIDKSGTASRSVIKSDQFVVGQITDPNFTTNDYYPVTGAIDYTSSGYGYCKNEKYELPKQYVKYGPIITKEELDIVTGVGVKNTSFIKYQIDPKYGLPKFYRVNDTSWDPHISDFGHNFQKHNVTGPTAVVDPNWDEYIKDEYDNYVTAPYVQTNFEASTDYYIKDYDTLGGGYRKLTTAEKSAGPSGAIQYYVKVAGPYDRIYVEKYVKRDASDSLVPFLDYALANSVKIYTLRKDKQLYYEIDDYRTSDPNRWKQVVEAYYSDSDIYFDNSGWTRDYPRLRYVQDIQYYRKRIDKYYVDRWIYNSGTCKEINDFFNESVNYRLFNNSSELSYPEYPLFFNTVTYANGSLGTMTADSTTIVVPKGTTFIDDKNIYIRKPFVARITLDKSIQSIHDMNGELLVVYKDHTSQVFSSINRTNMTLVPSTSVSAQISNAMLLQYTGISTVTVSPENSHTTNPDTTITHGNDEISVIKDSQQFENIRYDRVYFDKFVEPRREYHNYPTLNTSVRFVQYPIRFRIKDSTNHAYDVPFLFFGLNNKVYYTYFEPNKEMDIVFEELDIDPIQVDNFYIEYNTVTQEFTIFIFSRKDQTASYKFKVEIDTTSQNIVFTNKQSLSLTARDTTVPKTVIDNVVLVPHNTTNPSVIRSVIPSLFEPLTNTTMIWKYWENNFIEFITPIRWNVPTLNTNNYAIGMTAENTNTMTSREHFKILAQNIYNTFKAELPQPITTIRNKFSAEGLIVCNGIRVPIDQIKLYFPVTTNPANAVPENIEFRIAQEAMFDDLPSIRELFDSDGKYYYVRHPVQDPNRKLFVSYTDFNVLI